jgi:hypothetical protein
VPIAIAVRGVQLPCEALVAEVLVVADRGAAAQPLRPEQHQPIAEQADRGRGRRREHAPQRVLEQQAQQPGWDRAEDQEPAEEGVGVARRDAAPPDRPPQPAHDPRPVAPEEAQQDQRGSEMGGDEERQERVVVLLDVPAQQLRRDHAVAEAGDREQLRRTLDQTEHDGLEVGDHASARRRMSRVAGPAANSATAP